MTMGGGAMFAFGFRALGPVPQPPTAAAAAATVVPLSPPIEQVSSPIEQMDDLRPHQGGAVMLYVLAISEATPLVVQKRARPAARPMSQVAAAAAAGPRPATGNGFSYGYCTWWGGPK